MVRSPDVTSRIMSAVRNTGTRPELALRREIHKRGLRYRVTTKVVGRPDLVFARPHVACFVDGDRWHGNGWRIRGLKSFEEEFNHSNADFWKAKITRNIERDREVDQKLREEGWVVFRVWASDVERDVRCVADDLENLIRARLKDSS